MRARAARRARLSTAALSSERLSAERTEASRTSSSNGFSRKSTAPHFIASTASGTSPCPVMTMTGKPDLHLPEPAQQVDAAQPRHPHVGDDAAGGDLRRGVEKARRRIIGPHRETGAAQQEVERFAHRLVVVDHVNVRVSGHREGPLRASRQREP